MAYQFTPPTVKETPAGGHTLFERMGINRGISVLRVNGVYSSYRYPSQTQTLEADEVYLGGHVYDIDDQTRTRLIAAGYGDYITTV
jgi:hypothetical protein